MCTNCKIEPDARFEELAPVLEKYAKVPGSLITILQLQTFMKNLV